MAGHTADELMNHLNGIRAEAQIAQVEAALEQFLEQMEERAKVGQDPGPLSVHLDIDSPMTEVVRIFEARGFKFMNTCSGWWLMSN